MKFLGTVTVFICLALATAVITARAQSSGPLWGAISPGSSPAADKSKRDAPKERAVPRRARNDQSGSLTSLRSR
jgi:hypothetical protein